MSGLRKSSLSPARTKLVDLMRRVRFGTIEELILEDGEPRLDRRLLFSTTFRAGDTEARKQGSYQGGDYFLKAQVVDLMARFDEIRDGEIVKLEIREGLPHFMSIRHSAEALI